jgi:hypothetical protein
MTVYRSIPFAFKMKARSTLINAAKARDPAHGKESRTTMELNFFLEFLGKTSCYLTASKGIM